MRGVTIRNTAGAAVFVRSDLPEISESVITRNAIGVQCDTNSFVNVVGSVISYNSVDESAATRHSLALPTVPDDKPRKRQ